MAVHPHEIDWRYPFDESGADIFTGDVNHAFIKANGGIKYKWRAITIVNGKAVLAGNNGRVIGSFLHFHSGRAVVRLASTGTRYKNADRPPIEVGSKIIGGVRRIIPGGVEERGFIKAILTAEDEYNKSNITRIIKGVGYVTNGGGRYNDGVDPVADVIVAQSIGS